MNSPQLTVRVMRFQLEANSYVYLERCHRPHPPVWLHRHGDIIMKRTRQPLVSIRVVEVVSHSIMLKCMT